MLVSVPTSRLRHHLSFAQVIEGETNCAARLRAECALIEQLNASHVALEAVAITGEGVSFVFDGRDGARFTQAIRDLNVAVKIRDKCARINLTRSPTDWPLPTLDRLMSAFDHAGIDVVHLAADASAITVLVDDADAARAGSVFAQFYSRSGSSGQ